MDGETAKGLDTPAVVNKYREAASILTKALLELSAHCVPDADVSALCAEGDTLLEHALSLVYSSAKFEKGIAVPTCISANHICAYYSPFAEETTHLATGDLVKLDMGVHIDGYIATATNSFVVGASPENKVSGVQADVVLAAYYSLQAALRLLRPGNTNYMVTEAIGKVCAAYNCRVVEGVLSHEMKQHVFDGNKCIISKETFDQHVEEFAFGPYECYAVDVFVSTGEGKLRESELRTTVYQRALDVTYNLKLKASRSFLAELNRRFPTLLFTLRAFGDQRNAKLGVSECLKHYLLYNYPVLTEKPGEFVASFKATVLILPEDVVVSTPLIFDPEAYDSQYSVQDPELLALLNTPMQTVYALKPKKKRNKKKKQHAEEDN